MATATPLPISEIVKLTVPEYDALPRVRSTSLKSLVEKSPKHYHHEQQQPKKTSAAMHLGIATHAALFEPDKYRRDVVTADMAGKKSKDWDYFVARHPNRIPILSKEAEAIAVMVEAIRSDPYASPYLRDGDPEVSILWTDSLTGIDCKARIDLLDESDGGNPLLIGLKTTRSLGKVFDSQVDEFLYQLSWAMYAAGYEAVRGVVPEIVEIVVETAPPHDVAVYRLHEDTFEAGMSLYRKALSTLAECRKTGRWPGVGGRGVQTLKLKPWARGMSQEEDYEVMHFPGVGDE